VICPADDLTTVTITLSRAQVDSVFRLERTGGVVPFLLAHLPRVRQVLESDPLLPKNTRLSASVLLGLLNLACFPADGDWLSNAEAARLARTNPSNAHRYVTTLVEAGLLERDPRTRHYRLLQPVGQSAHAPGSVASSDAAHSDRAESSRDRRAVIELSSEQIDQVRRAATERSAVPALLSGLLSPSEAPKDTSHEQLKDPRISRSLLTALLILALLPLDRGLLGNAELARMIDMSPSTAHRYVGTLRAVHLVERDPATRRFGLAR
jgi:DNA-binding MarR family transcriptional regulator